jgi:hypothetical protein
MPGQQRLVFFQRRITVDDVRHVLATGEIVEEYPEDLPYPSRLVLGRRGNRPVHVVAANNPENAETVVITAYEPSPAQWDPEFKRRRP